MEIEIVPTRTSYNMAGSSTNDIQNELHYLELLAEFNRTKRLYIPQVALAHLA
jgi:hypothetical protein